MSKKTVRELNKMLTKMMGKPMTKKEKALLEVLRGKVKRGEITQEQAHEFWRKKVLKEGQRK